ncbi:hypothetical protein DSM104299_01959 [Baekduia alba]|uniref:DUF4389 domain-containing protein n=1 Tax=Baekduia alba TaxID=2997333 RepID=UPI00233F8602|nr:DUF4389 domain-containing protein [Baekduia alba]WCB93252.1 hypothetical protein DSM104299_01959 [Baekduia alba]
MTDQPVFEAEYVEKRSRLTTFFRGILAIPHFIVLYVWGILAFFAIVFAWFAIVITGHYPPALYSFVAGLQRYSTAVYGYVALLTDEYPPFSGDTDNYPARLKIPPPKAEYNRLKTLFRIILAIPVLIIAYAMQIVWEVGAFLAWFVIVVMGKQPKGLQDMIVLGLSYQQRSYAYLTLLTEDWPPFTDPDGGSLASPVGGAGLPPAPATTAPPAAPEAPSASTGISGGDPLNG